MKGLDDDCRCKVRTIAHLQIIGLRVIDCFLFNAKGGNVSVISWQEQVAFRPDDDVCFVLDQHQ
jgi:hypothetical protein